MAPDRVELAATLFAPRVEGRQARRAVVINSAMAVPRRYYASFARFLAASGFHVVTYDYRGIGESGGPRSGVVGGVKSEGVCP